MFNRHKHNWDMLDKTVLPGLKNLGKVSAWGDNYAQVYRDHLDAKRDKVVYVFKCYCGDVKVVKK